MFYRLVSWPGPPNQQQLELSVKEPSSFHLPVILISHVPSDAFSDLSNMQLVQAFAPGVPSPVTPCFLLHGFV